MRIDKLPQRECAWLHNELIRWRAHAAKKKNLPPPATS